MSKFFKLTSICLLTASYAVTAHAESTLNISEDVTTSITSNELKIISFERMQGCYSDNGKSLTTSSICLFDDGTFYYPMFFGVRGKYALDGNSITFHTKHNDLFSVYGRHEPSTKKTQFQFANFTSDSLVNFDEGGFSDVSDEKQCLGKPRLEPYAHNQQVQKFSVAHVTGTNDRYQQRVAGSQMLTAFDYNYDPVFNDFLLIFHNIDESKNKIKGTVLIDNADMWLQIGKDVLSMQKMRISEAHVTGMKQLGAEIEKSGEKYQLINQDSEFSARDVQSYQHKREDNRFYTVNQTKSPTNKDNASAINNHKLDKGITNSHYLKLYEKLDPTGQSISEAFIESRVGAECP